jgi:hypothetical protein
VIQDVAEFRRTGVTGRRIGELNVPVREWRAAMCGVARRDGTRVRTFVLPFTAVGPDEDDGMVFAVRVRPPPDRLAGQGRFVRWWHVEELGMPFLRWRAALHRTARRERARTRTFLLPAGGADQADQIVYLVWADADPIVPPLAPPPPSSHAPRPVTDLVRYAAARHPSAGLRRDAEGRER